MIDNTFAEKIASCDAGMIEQEMDRMVQSQAIECVKTDELVRRDQVANVRTHVKCGFSQVNVYAVYDAIYEFFQLVHLRHPHNLWHDRNHMLHEVRLPTSLVSVRKGSFSALGRWDRHASRSVEIGLWRWPQRLRRARSPISTLREAVHRYASAQPHDFLAPFGAALGNPEMAGRETVRARTKNASFPNGNLAGRGICPGVSGWTLNGPRTAACATVLK